MSGKISWKSHENIFKTTFAKMTTVTTIAYTTNFAISQTDAKTTKTAKTCIRKKQLEN